MLTPEDLIEEDLDVVGGEWLRRHDHFVQVALHQLRDHVAAGGFSVKENRTHTQNDLRPHAPLRSTGMRKEQSFMSYFTFTSERGAGFRLASVKS